jgi:hypothetical protein
MTFWKLDLFPSSAERREMPTLFGPLEIANFNHPLPSPEDENIQFPNVVFSII